MYFYTNTVLILKVCNVIILTNIARIVSGGSYIKSQLNKYCNGQKYVLYGSKCKMAGCTQ